jgi:hypothetical protein
MQYTSAPQEEGIMRKASWKKWAVAVASGSVLLQTPGCAETAAVITSLSSLVTAGGVWYIVGRIIGD